MPGTADFGQIRKGSMMLRRAPSVVSVSFDSKHRFSKSPTPSITLVAGHGIEGDAHGGPFVRHRYLARRNPRAPNLRQVHLIRSELFEALRAAGYDVRAGDLGENIATRGLDLERLPLDTTLRIGASVVIKLTGLRTPCILIDRFQAGLRRRLFGKASDRPFHVGVMAIVSDGGTVIPGDLIQLVLPERPHVPLPPL